MPDIYKLKVLENSTNNFSSATYLQDTFVSLNFDINVTAGTIVDSSGTATALLNEYQTAGLMNLMIPFIYDSSLSGTASLLYVASYFTYINSMGIDVAGKMTTSWRWIYLTTDNSDYYISIRYRKERNAVVYYDSVELHKKSDNSEISSAVTVFGAASVYSAYDSNVNLLTMSIIGGNNKNIQFKVSTSTSANYTVISTINNETSANNGYALLVTNDEPYIENTDPYAGAGDSTTGGGDGTFDGSSDPVPVPSLPSIGATDTGFISLFVPSASQIRQVATYLWGPLLDISTFKKLFEDPMDCILGLSVVPVSVPTSGNAQITVGNVELSGITLPLASQQYVELDCGTITFDRYFGSYLDFEPYTKMSLFVPYSGIHSVSADDIIGKTVGLKYHIDILTGSLVAFLTCGNSVLYEFNGACASNIPVNSMNYASTIENAIRIAVNIGTTVATAGAAAPATGAVEDGKVAAGGAGIGPKVL